MLMSRGRVLESQCRIPTRFKFWIEEDPGCNQYQMTFCKKCGDYVCMQNDDYEKIICKC